MDEETVDSLAGAITAQNFILQNLWALILSGDSDPTAAAQATGREMLRQFEDLPVTNPGEGEANRNFRITQHGIHHLERFWANVEGRLQSLPEGRD